MSQQESEEPCAMEEGLEMSVTEELTFPLTDELYKPEPTDGTEPSVSYFENTVIKTEYPDHSSEESKWRIPGTVLRKKGYTDNIVKCGIPDQVVKEEPLEPMQEMDCEGSVVLTLSDVLSVNESNTNNPSEPCKEMWSSDTNRERVQRQDLVKKCVGGGKAYKLFQQRNQAAIRDQHHMKSKQLTRVKGIMATLESLELIKMSAVFILISDKPKVKQCSKPIVYGFGPLKDKILNDDSLMNFTHQKDIVQDDVLDQNGAITTGDLQQENRQIKLMKPESILQNLGRYMNYPTLQSPSNTNVNDPAAKVTFQSADCSADELIRNASSQSAPTIGDDLVEKISIKSPSTISDDHILEVRAQPTGTSDGDLHRCTPDVAKDTNLTSQSQDISDEEPMDDGHLLEEDTPTASTAPKGKKTVGVAKNYKSSRGKYEAKKSNQCRIKSTQIARIRKIMSRLERLDLMKMTAVFTAIDDRPISLIKRYVKPMVYGFGPLKDKLLNNQPLINFKEHKKSFQCNKQEQNMKIALTKLYPGINPVSSINKTRVEMKDKACSPMPESQQSTKTVRQQSDTCAVHNVTTKTTENNGNMTASPVWKSSIKDPNGKNQFKVEAVNIGGNLYYRTVTDLPSPTNKLIHTAKVIENKSCTKVKTEPGIYDPVPNDDQSCDERHRQYDKNVKLSQQKHAGEEAQAKSYVKEEIGCGQGVDASGNLKKHQSLHKAKNPDTYSHSGNGSTTFDLRHHTLTHVIKKTHQNQDCGIQSQSHCHNKQVPTVDKPHKCSFCEKSFNDHRNLQKHERTHRDNIDSRKDSVWIRNYCLNKQVSTGYKPHKCSFCDKIFNNHYNLQKHERTHGDKNV